MGCCGQGRAALRAQSATARGRAGLPRASGAGRPPHATTMLRYLGQERVRVRGSMSGHLYEFAAGEHVRVAAGDAPVMIRTGLFARA